MNSAAQPQRSVALREAITAPISTAHSGLDDPSRWIKFRHPWYSDALGQNILLNLRPYDSEDGGLQYGIAFSACAIVAGNAWDGWLTETKAGEKLVKDWDDLLLGSNYYFHVSPGGSPETEAGETSSPFQYPIVPTFRHWSFPHEYIPEQWRGPGSTSNAMQPPPLASGVTNYVHNRDGGCVISKSRDNLERAHLCPRSESEWFSSNRMEQYNLSMQVEPAVDDSANGISMRSDLHNAFDVYKKFVIAPKGSQWAVHFLEPTMDIGNLYHNCPLDLSVSISPQFLLSRFAWAIFPKVRAFLRTNSTKAIKVPVMTEHGLAEEVKILAKDELTKILDSTKSKSRTPSPTKQQKRTAPEDDCGSDQESSGSVPRGRKRHRPGTPETGDSQATTLTTEFEALKERLLLAQRPKDPQLICCDYNAADEAVRKGLTGPKEHGGAHLCLQCLGLEYQDEI